MKLLPLSSTAVAMVITAVAVSSSAAGSPGARIVPGFRSPSGNISCYYNPKAPARRGTRPLLTCGLRHADYAMQLQRRCLAGDWHGWELDAKAKPTLFCTGNPDFSIQPAYTTLAYGASWTRGPLRAPPASPASPAGTSAPTASLSLARPTARGSPPRL